MAEMVPGSQQRHQMLAGESPLGDIQREIVHRFFPRLSRARFNVEARIVGGGAGMAHEVVDKQNEIAALDQVAPMQPVAAGTYPQPIQVSPVGASEIAKGPAGLA